MKGKPREKGNNNPLRGFVAVAHKEYLHLIRNWQFCVFLLVTTILNIVFMGWAINTNVRQVSMAVYDLSNTQASRTLVNSFVNTDTFKVVKRVYSDQELYDAMVAGEVRVGIKIPADYSSRILKGSQANILVLTDGSNSIVTTAALGATQGVVAQESFKYGSTEFSQFSVPALIEAREMVLFNPNSYAPNFIIPGLLATQVQAIALFMAAFAVAYEREKGTLEQLYLTPARPLGVLIGKLLPYALLAYVQQSIVLILSYLLFGLTIKGSYLLLVVLTVPFLWLCFSLGALVSVYLKTMESTNQILTAIDLFSIFLSGLFFEITSMPKVFQWFSVVLPTTHYINITRGIMVRGAGLQHLWPSALIMLISGTIIISIAAWQYERKRAKSG